MQEKIETVDLDKKLRVIQEYWKPKIIAEVNDSYVKIVKMKGEFVWHHHDTDDELFFVRKGKLTIKLNDREIQIGEGNLVVIPKGTEHKPVAEDEVEVLLLEPKTTSNTGNLSNERTTVPDWI